MPKQQKQQKQSVSQQAVKVFSFSPIPYDRVAMDYNHKDLGKKMIDNDWEVMLHPEFGKDKYFKHFPVYVEIEGRAWEVDLFPRPYSNGDNFPQMEHHDIHIFPFVDDGYTHLDRMVTLRRTDKEFINRQMESKNTSSFIRMFGQGNFHNVGHASIQVSEFPMVGQDGKIIRHLMTVNTEWGDMGTEVYFLETDKNGYPVRVLFEASCS